VSSTKAHNLDGGSRLEFSLVLEDSGLGLGMTQVARVEALRRQHLRLGSLVLS
jgi:hypothetical protein